MKVMVIVKASQASEAGEMPNQQLLAEMGKFNQELAEAGVILAGEGLHPSSKGVRVAFNGRERTVIDGPFAETKELIAGYWMWQVKSMQEAIDWVKRCPNPHPAPCEIEIRQVFSADDFGAELTPELREQEAATRATAMGLGTVRFENAPAILVAGVNSPCSVQSRDKIPQLWAKFAPRIGKIAGQVGGKSYGVSWNATSDGKFDYLTGVEVADGAALPADFTKITLPAGRYAVVPHHGPISELPTTLEKVWRQWLPDSSLKVASAPCYERYDEKFDPSTSAGMELWIPLQS